MAACRARTSLLTTQSALRAAARPFSRDQTNGHFTPQAGPSPAAPARPADGGGYFTVSGCRRLALWTTPRAFADRPRRRRFLAADHKTRHINPDHTAARAVSSLSLLLQAFTDCGLYPHIAARRLDLKKDRRDDDDERGAVAAPHDASALHHPLLSRMVRSARRAAAACATARDGGDARRRRTPAPPSRHRGRGGERCP